MEICADNLGMKLPFLTQKFNERSVDDVLRISFDTQEPGFHIYIFELKGNGDAQFKRKLSYKSPQEFLFATPKAYGNIMLIKSKSHNETHWFSSFTKTRVINYKLKNNKIVIGGYTNEVAYKRYLEEGSKMYKLMLPSIREEFKKIFKTA